MCNTFLSHHVPRVKYPHSNLKYPTYKYERLIENFLSSMYGGIEFRVITFTESVGVIIYNVNPYGIYHPHTFDPSYAVKSDEKDVVYISQYDFFETFYNYIPDIVPYLIFKLVPPRDYDSVSPDKLNPDGSFAEFDLKEFYFKEEHRKEFNGNEKRFDNVW